MCLISSCKKRSTSCIYLETIMFCWSGVVLERKGECHVFPAVIGFSRLLVRLIFLFFFFFLKAYGPVAEAVLPHRS